LRIVIGQEEWFCPCNWLTLPYLPATMGLATTV